MGAALSIHALFGTYLHRSYYFHGGRLFQRPDQTVELCVWAPANAVDEDHDADDGDAGDTQLSCPLPLAFYSMYVRGVRQQACLLTWRACRVTHNDMVVGCHSSPIHDLVVTIQSLTTLLLLLLLLPMSVYLSQCANCRYGMRIDRLLMRQQLELKVASNIGQKFKVRVLEEVCSRGERHQARVVWLRLRQLVACPTGSCSRDAVPFTW